MSTIAVDIMGGDNAPHAILEGVAEFLDDSRFESSLLLVGDQQEIETGLSRLGISNNQRVEIVHSTQVIDMNEPAVAAIRSKRDSSINVATKLVKDGRAQAVYSAGSTGAAVAGTVIRLRKLAGIDRPGIATTFPSPAGPFVLLDAGATVDCKPQHLVHYAIMGGVFAEHILGRKSPRIGLLSVGSEDVKGNELTKETFKRLSKIDDINFVGNVEGHDLFAGNVDVVVCDGFVGNVVLKCCESLAKAIGSVLKENLMKTPVRKLGAFLSQNAFKELKSFSNPDEYGGAALLGINGICIIGHGSSSPCAVKNALRVAEEFINHQVNKHIVDQVEQLLPSK